ncbi:hypothetical protein Gxy13693_012_030 [Komagataeibacter xylinus NBRC 13693]|uniref:Uncharacterized protein n=1 Tax=Komagataeibacter xylinus NBRC 13693 TaxID=1234668 RepID=A0A0D6Q5Y1_KOMXY|nr:hypothetical protein Gxy13693_012_030 [Komagataeibacter xylinus NBRC 13693]
MKWTAPTLDFGHVIDHLHQTKADENGMIGRILSRSIPAGGKGAAAVRGQGVCACVNGFAG